MPDELRQVATLSLEGVTGAPYRHPKIQKKMPAPYSRPSISIGAAEVKRGWKQTHVTDLAEGDVVAAFGRIASVREWINRDPYEWNVVLTNVVGVTATYSGHDSVLAFSRD
jgi:hypothetical protein